MEQKEIIKNKKMEKPRMLKRPETKVMGLENEIPFTYASVWKLEVDRVIIAIELGIKTKWEF